MGLAHEVEAPARDAQPLRVGDALFDEVLDPGEATAAEAQAALETVRGRMAQQVYDPGRWPLFEIRVTRLAAGVTARRPSTR